MQFIEDDPMPSRREAVGCGSSSRAAKVRVRLYQAAEQGHAPDAMNSLKGDSDRKLTKYIHDAYLCGIRPFE